MCGERIRGELLKLGVKVSKRTIQRYMCRVRGPRPYSQTWATFLRNHASQIWACDFVQTYNLFFRAIFVFVIIEYHSRRVIHVGITFAPTDRWVTQQLREPTAFGAGPQYLIRDNDKKYGAHFSLIAASSGIQELKMPYQSPNLNARCERFIGSLRRDCLDHILILNERQLRARVTEYVRYFNEARPHQGLAQRIPEADAFPAKSSTSGAKIISSPVLGGLHHDYRRVAITGVIVGSPRFHNEFRNHSSMQVRFRLSLIYIWRRVWRYMPLPVTLDFQENGYIAHYVFTGSWQVGDLPALYAREAAHRQAVGHTVHTMLDIRAMANIPPGAITARRGSPTFTNKNDGHVVVVGASRFAQSVLELVCKLTHYTQVKVVGTEAEGLAYLRQLIPHDTARIEQPALEPGQS